MKLLDLQLRTHNVKLCYDNIKPLRLLNFSPKMSLYRNLKRDLTLRLEETKNSNQLKSGVRISHHRSIGQEGRSIALVKKAIVKNTCSRVEELL